jgi:hypothetical protein
MLYSLRIKEVADKYVSPEVVHDWRYLRNVGIGECLWQCSKCGVEGMSESIRATYLARPWMETLV